MKAIARIAVLMVLSVSVLLGQRPPNCDAGCGGFPAPTVGTGAAPIETSSSFTNARGTGSSLVATEHVGKSAAIEGSQSYTYAVNLFSLPGRNSLNLDLTLYYNSLVWEYNSDNNTMVYGGFDNPSPGFRLDYGLLQFATDLSLGILTEPNGAKHLFAPTTVANQFMTKDSTYIYVQYPATAGNPVIVTYKNGLRVFYQVFDTTYLYQYRPYQIEDTNGNIISIAYLNSNALSINTIADTVGRVIKFSYDSTGTMLQSVAQLNSSGQVFRQYTFTWVNKPINFNFTLKATAGLGIPSGYLTSGQSTENLLAKVTRPDNTSVIFDYVKDLNATNPDNADWGVVKSIQEQSSNGTSRYTTSYLFPAASAGTLTRGPTYTAQTVNDGVNTGTWQFQATKNTSGTVTCYADIDPLSRLRTTTFSSLGDALDGLPLQRAISSVAPGTPFSGCTTSVAKTWRTVNQSWTTDTDGSNARLTSMTTVLEDGSTQSQVKFNSYDSFGQVTDQQLYDLGASQPGSLLAESVTSYASLHNGIVNRPSEIKIKDGGGAVISDTKFNYDEGTVSSVSPLPASGTHDELNYSASSTNARGNLTSLINYVNAATQSGAITSTLTYDEFGNVLTVQAGSGPQTHQSFSLVTQYAYPDSSSVGSSGNQLSVGYVYDLDHGRAKTVTDPNGQSSTIAFDIDNRISSVTAADGVTATATYDDASAKLSFTVSNTANSLVAKMVADDKGRLLSQQTLNGTSVISSRAFTSNIAGQLLLATNPYGPTDSIVNTSYSYDPLDRELTMTPPAIGSAAQNPYQTDHSVGTFADSAGSMRSGEIVTTTDSAGKQRRRYLDALGRVVRVDEPGQKGGSAGSGSIAISGSEQSASVPNGGGATAATGSVTFTGTERSTQVLTHNATPGSATVTISGSEAQATIDPCYNPDIPPPSPSCPRQIWDSGSVSITVNGHTDSASYGNGSTTVSIASALSAAINGDAAASVTASASGAVVTLTAKTAGAATNYSFATSSATNDVPDFGVPSFTAQASGSTLSGGTDTGYTTFYDTGNVTVTVNGFSKSSPYSQGATSSSVASDLANKFNGDSTSPVIANASGSVLSLTTKTTGASTNYPLSTSAATNSQYFTAGSTSFSGTPSGNTLTLGQNGTIYDAGTVTVSITGFTATPMSYTANYSQGSTGNSVASAIAGAINGNSLSPVTATVGAGSNTISLTAKTLGSDTNYGISATSATTQAAYFSQPSFSSSGTTLSGGTDPGVSLSSPLSTFSLYDAMGNLLKVIQGQQIRTYQYDSLGRMTSSCVPEMNNQCTAFTYRDFGAVATKLDPRSITTTYAYDSFSRLQTVSYSDGTPAVTYAYGAGAGNNAAGRLTNISSSVAQEGYTYDNLGRVTQCVKTIGGQNYTVSYHYDAKRQLDYITYPSGRVVYQDHDSIGRLSQIRTGGTNVFSIGSLNAAGEILKTTYGNGMTGAYTYNNRLQLTSLVAANSGGPVLNLSYGYGGANDNGASDNGQIARITDGINPARSTSYVYDELGRLKIAQTSDLTSANTWMLKFSYDRYGNRLSQIPAAGTGSMPMSEIAVDPTTNRLTNLAYDADGNVINDTSHTYTYNALNQIISVDGANNTYTYDPKGLRVNKNGTVYIYNGAGPIAEYPNGAVANSPSAEYIRVGGKLVASVTSGVFAYYYTDHLSTRITADGSGTVSRTFGHFPFGETWYETGTPNKWKFTTYERDGESGLDYANARHFSTRMGRFMQLDPLSSTVASPQSLNRYAYVKNDPINLIDATGMGDDCPEFTNCGDNYAPLLDDVACEGTFAGCSNAADYGPPPTDWNDLPDAPMPKPDCCVIDATLTFTFNATAPLVDLPAIGGDISDLAMINESDGITALTSSRSSSSDAFEPGSLAYEVFQGSAQTWRAASGTVDGLLIGYTAGFAVAGGIIAAPTVIAYGTGIYYGYGGYAAAAGGGIAFLGRNPEYLEDAEEMGGAALNMPQALWNYLDAAGESWTANRVFLDTLATRGTTIYFSSPLSRATYDSNYWLELQYLGDRLGQSSSEFANPLVTAPFK